MTARSNAKKRCGRASDNTAADDAAELRQTAADLHALTKRLQDVREEERAALSRELHDSLGQHLTAFALTFESVRIESQVLADGPPGFVKLHKKIFSIPYGARN